MFLEEEKEQPKKQAMEKQFINRFSEKVQNVSWLNSYYLIISMENKNKIIEIDDRDKINSYDLALATEKLLWDSSGKRLFFIDREETLKFNTLTSF